MQPRTWRDWLRSYEPDVTVVDPADFLTLDDAYEMIPLRRAWVNMAWVVRLGRVATRPGPYLREDLGVSRKEVEAEAARWHGASRSQRLRMKAHLLLRAAGLLP